MRQQLGAAPSRTYDDVTKTYVDTAIATTLKIASNLSDLNSASSARTNLGLGTVATMAGPSGTIVGTTDTQTLSNKTIAAGGLTFNGSSNGSTVLSPATSASGVLTLPSTVDTLTANNATQTLANKTLTAPHISTIVNTGTLTLPTSTDTMVGRATTDTLTNKTLTSPAINGGTLSSVTIAYGSNTITGLPYDLSLMGFGASTVRATGTGDNPMGLALQRACTLTKVTFRCATADASGNLVVALNRNGSAITGTSTTIAASSQVAGGTSTFSQACSIGDIITINVTGVGTTPGNGLIADITGSF